MRRLVTLAEGWHLVIRVHWPGVYILYEWGKNGLLKQAQCSLSSVSLIRVVISISHDSLGSVLTWVVSRWSEQLSFECNKGYRQRQQADQKGQNYSSQCMTVGDDQFHCSLGGKLLAKKANSTQLVVTGSGLINDVLYEQCAVLHQDKGLERERNRQRQRQTDRNRDSERQWNRERHRQKERELY